MNSQNQTEKTDKLSGITFRDAVEADIESLSALDDILFPPEIAFGLDVFYYYFHHPRAVFIIAEEDDELLGFVATYCSARRTGQILTIDVHPDYHRRGLGSALMLRMETRLSAELGTRRILLEVAVDNAPARAMYSKHGFKDVTIIKRYYPDGTDAVRMIKNL